jgi:hypothetical protein
MGVSSMLRDPRTKFDASIIQLYHGERKTEKWIDF